MAVRIRKEKREYYFSVEGQTEQWYLEHLQALINGELSKKDAPFTVKFNVKVEKNPLSYVKWATIRGNPMVITHVFDYEGVEHDAEFRAVLNLMREAENLKNIRYNMAYSNLSLELWMILHKTSCNGSVVKCDQYLNILNSAFGENFSSLDHYKEERNFKRLLQDLSLKDVRCAIQSAQKIEQRNLESHTPQLHKKYRKIYSYYKENPSLNLHTVIDKLFQECQL